jgi:hypothetical protein
MELIYRGFEKENGWEDLSQDPRWQSIDRLPDEGREVMVTYFKGEMPRNYEVVVWKDDILEDWHVTHWYYMD